MALSLDVLVSGLKAKKEKREREIHTPANFCSSCLAIIVEGQLFPDQTYLILNREQFILL